MKGNPQRALFEAENPLVVNGVIYCIIHLPRSKVYVGQTINGAHQRLLTHWHTRGDDFRSNGLHNQIRRHLHSSQFVAWPLEYIDTHLQEDIGTTKCSVKSLEFGSTIGYVN